MKYSYSPWQTISCIIFLWTQRSLDQKLCIFKVHWLYHQQSPGSIYIAEQHNHPRAINTGRHHPIQWHQEFLHHQQRWVIMPVSSAFIRPIIRVETPPLMVFMDFVLPPFTPCTINEGQFCTSQCPLQGVVVNTTCARTKLLVRSQPDVSPGTIGC